MTHLGFSSSRGEVRFRAISWIETSLKLSFILAHRTMPAPPRADHRDDRGPHGWCSWWTSDIAVEAPDQQSSRILACALMGSLLPVYRACTQLSRQRRSMF